MIQKKIEILFRKWAKETAREIVSISPSGSSRKYYRITGATQNAIGVFNNNHKENMAFLNFTKHFFNEGLNVPEIYDENIDENIYLLQDLGDETLFSKVKKERTREGFTSELVMLYKNAIDALIKFQILAGKKINFNYCYPGAYFDKQSILWDLNYFKYYFLRLVNIPYDEQKLENDFYVFASYLTQHEKYEYFMYRDFQSRNIMLYNDQLYFIDYQGGRRGALQYDLASLLYQAKADIPEKVRDELLMYYIRSVSKIIAVQEKEFIRLYRGYSLIRMLQVLGAYGFRGIIEKKEHFIQSIPFAIKNIELFLKNYSISVKMPQLTSVIELITQTDINGYGK